MSWALLALTLTVAALQLMRIGHHLLAGRSALADVALLSGLALPTLIIALAPAAVLGGLLLTAQRLRVEGVWETLEAAGARPWQRAWPLLAVALSVALLVAALGRWAEPRALAASEVRLWRQGARAWLHQLSSGRWHELGGQALARRAAGSGQTGAPALALRAVAVSERCADALTLHGLILAGGEPPAVIVARRALLEIEDTGALRLTLRDGEVARGASAGLTAWRWGFVTARQRLDLRGGLARHLGWLQRDRADGAAAAQRAGLCLLLGLGATLVGLRAQRPAPAAAIALIMLAGAELGGFAVGLALVAANEALWHAGRWRRRRRAGRRSPQRPRPSLPSTCS
ncbi:MAG: LptF/LptG family permease [Proteobacteria bacterium]|nr:LptF/LptG family permease [Pseudomonadota bacterium]